MHEVLNTYAFMVLVKTNKKRKKINELMYVVYKIKKPKGIPGSLIPYSDRQFYCVNRIKRHY